LAARMMSQILKTVLAEAVKAVTFIKAFPLNLCIFMSFVKRWIMCMNKVLLIFKYVGCIAKKNSCFLFELCSEIQTFLTDKTFQGSESFDDFSQLGVVDLPDIFM
jgi:hypothetical protein